MKIKDTSHLILVDKKTNKILLVKKSGYPGWVIPGGGVEKLEKPEEAAVRETYEESGYRAKVIKKFEIYNLFLIFWKFRAYVFKGNIVSKSNIIIKEKAAWHSLDKLPEMLKFQMRMISDFQKSGRIRTRNYRLIIIEDWKIILKNPLSFIYFILSQVIKKVELVN